MHFGMHIQENCACTSFLKLGARTSENIAHDFVFMNIDIWLSKSLSEVMRTPNLWVLMTKDEYSTEMELYGVSPAIIGMIIFSITLVVPYGFVPDWVGFPWGATLWNNTVYSLFWGCYSGYSFFVLTINEILTLLPFTFLNLLYAYWIVQYYQAKRSGFAVVAIGFLSLLLPFLIVVINFLLVGPPLHFIYPIPVQFILGLLILKRIEGPDVISPWSGVRLDLSWWKWKHARRTRSDTQAEREKETSEKEDWLDG
jgi:hypothetical protein